jgi:hypothetical protein
MELYLRSPYVFMPWCVIKFRDKFTVNSLQTVSRQVDPLCVQCGTVALSAAAASTLYHGRIEKKLIILCTNKIT